MHNRAEYFEQLYRRSDDPWHYRSSDFEHAKYRHTVEALPRSHYASGLEIGCSIGILSAALARRCERFLGVDVAPAAVMRAREHNAACDHARFMVAEVPAAWPADSYDLVVLSEVLYYLTEQEIADLALVLARDLLPCADLVLVNWRGSTSTPLGGEQAARLFREELSGHGRACRLSSSIRPKYRLDVMSFAT